MRASADGNPEPPSDDSTLSVPDAVLTRRAAGEMVLLNLDNERYYGLEGVGIRVWELIETGSTFGQVVEVLHREYGVEREVLVGDLTAIIADLKDNGLLLVDAT